MNEPLEVVNRFFKIIMGSDRNSSRLQSEWAYLYKLLRADSISYDRIDAYLNILQQQDSATKRTTTRKSQTQHPQAPICAAAIEAVCKLMDENEEKIQAYIKMIEKH